MKETASAPVRSRSTKFQEPPTAMEGSTIASPAFEFATLRSRVLFRFASDVAGALKQPIESIFNLLRYQLRFSGTLLESGDEQALIAGTPEDDQMIRIFEHCFNDVGFAVLRALSVVRILGAPAMQELGLFALLRSLTLTTQFMGLALCIHSDLRVNAFAQYQSKVVMAQAANEMTKFIHFFQRSSSAMRYPVDSVFTEPTYCSTHRVQSKVTLADEKIQKDEEKMKELVDQGVDLHHPLIAFTRMVMQAARCPHRTCASFDTGSFEGAEWVPPTLLAIASILPPSSPPASSSSALSSNLQAQKEAAMLSSLLIECLEPIDEVRRAAVGLNVDLQNYAEVTGRHIESFTDEALLHRLASDPRLAVRMVLVDVVAVTVYLEKATRNRSDLTSAISQRLRVAQEADFLDLLGAL